MNYLSKVLMTIATILTVYNDAVARTREIQNPRTAIPTNSSMHLKNESLHNDAIPEAMRSLIPNRTEAIPIGIRCLSPTHMDVVNVLKGIPPIPLTTTIQLFPGQIVVTNWIRARDITMAREALGKEPESEDKMLDRTAVKDQSVVVAMKAIVVRHCAP